MAAGVSPDASICSLYASCPLTKPGSTDWQGHSIRILLLAPAAGLSDPLRGQLQTAWLEEPDRLPYTALSYTWGPPFVGQRLPSGSITLNTTFELSITGNLDHALRRIRGDLDMRPVWVDAICINQRDDKERTQQVARMAKVYSLASKVVGWLGEDSAEFDGSFILDTDQSNIERDRLLQRYKLWTAEHCFKPEDKPWAHIDRLLLTFTNRRHFQRRWVVQETVHGRSNLTFCCGPYEVPWQRLWTTLDKYARLADELPLAQESLERMYQLFEHDKRIIANRNESRSNDMVDILLGIQPLECVDDRDRICAVLSLCSQPCHGFEPDYTLRCDAMYCKFARALLGQNNTYAAIKVLCAAALQASEPDRAMGLPSWVPDWRVTIPAVGIQVQEPLSEDINVGLESQTQVVAQLPIYGVVGKSISIAEAEINAAASHLKPQPGDTIVGPVWAIIPVDHHCNRAIVLRPTGSQHYFAGTFSITNASPTVGQVTTSSYPAMGSFVII